MWNVSKFTELPEEVQLEIFDRCKDTNESFEDFCILVDITFGFNEFVKECFEDYTTICDSYDKTCIYYFLTDSYRVSVEGNSYIKGQCICDEDLQNNVEVYSIDEYKESVRTITILESEYIELIKIKNLYESTSSK